MPERKFLTSNPTRHNAGTYKVGHSSVAWAPLERGLHFWKQTFGFSQLWQFALNKFCELELCWGTFSTLGISQNASPEKMHHLIARISDFSMETLETGKK